MIRIAIASGKGGTGKTFVATNFAEWLSNQNAVPGGVVLGDLDVEEPNSGLFMNLEQIARFPVCRQVPVVDQGKCTLCSLCAEKCNFNALALLEDRVKVFPELCHSCEVCARVCPDRAIGMQPYPTGQITHFRSDKLDFFEGRLITGEPSGVFLIGKLKEYITGQSGPDATVLLDSPPGTSCSVIEATKDADYVVLVTEPTPFGLHDLQLSFDVMKYLHKKFGVVINKYGIGNRDTEIFCTRNKIPVLSRIPHDREYAGKYAGGKLVTGPGQAFEKYMSELHQNITTAL